jgi:ectoine hydrolase
MTIHFMPALWLDDGGIELSESILIGQAAPRCWPRCRARSW